MKYYLKIVIFIAISFIYNNNILSQDIRLFNEYIQLFSSFDLEDTYRKYDDIGILNSNVSDRYFKFLSDDIKDTIETSPWLIFKTNGSYLAVLTNVKEDFLVYENNKYSYHLIFYDNNGNIISSYKLLEGIVEKQFIEIFFSKKKIKYVIYTDNGDSNYYHCYEVENKFKVNGVMEEVAKKTYKKKKDQWNW
ncbi:MAG: hypothetical protein ACK5MH_09465 [Bacteroidales bacterium]